MKQVQFIYGNQDFDIQEKKEKIIDSILPKEKQKDALFRFDCKDLLNKDKNAAKNLLAEFQNTCETVSFLSPTIIIDLFNLQEIKTTKSPTEAIEKELSQITLAELLEEENANFYDSSTISVNDRPIARVRCDAIVSDIIPCSKNNFYLKPLPNWEKRHIFSRTPEGDISTTLEFFLQSKLKKNITFKYPDDQNDLQTANLGSPFVNLLKKYIQSPPVAVYFILTASVRKPTEIKRNIYPLLKKHADETKTLISYDDFNPVQWVIRKAEEKGVKLSRITADLLIELAGSELSTLDMELTKLSLLHSKGSFLEPEELIKSVSHSKYYSIFRVSSFLAQKDLKNSIESLELILYENISDIPGIYGLISSNFRRMLKIIWMVESGMKEKEIIAYLKINPWIGKEQIRLAKNYSVEELENIIILLATRDLKTKYAGADAISILKNICFLICTGSLKKTSHLESKWIPE